VVEVSLRTPTAQCFVARATLTHRIRRRRYRRPSTGLDLTRHYAASPYPDPATSTTYRRHATSDTEAVQAA
jgi:hypothetical protein